MKQATVSIVRLNSYNPADVKKAMTNLLEPLGGLSQMLNCEKQAVIKPNFLMPKPTRTAVCTHPEVIRAAAGLLKEAGFKNTIVTDSPGVGTAKIVASRLGLHNNETFKVEDVAEVIDIEQPELVFQKLRISKTIARCENLINIAKAKTHAQMIITGAVKNTFGAVAGLEKAQWHYRTGRDPLNFARLIVQIHQMTSPRINILDAVTAMEGNGPGSGTPRGLGVLIASTNAHALDYVLCQIWNINPQSIYTLKVAKEIGVLPSPDEIKIIGPSPNELAPSPPWKMATPKKLRRIIGPDFLIPVFDRLMSIKPQVKHSKCITCGECVNLCAAKAMSFDLNGKLIIDEKKCISCFCCQEMCPTGAISVRSGMLSKIIDFNFFR